MENTKAVTHLPWKVRLSFGAGNVAKVLINTVMAAYMLFFYVDVMGMDELVVSAIILISKVWDIVNDPIMGVIVDKTRGRKEGKCRFWLKYFSVPGGVCLALCMFMPELTATGKIIWVAVTYVLQSMVATILLIPMNTMIGRVSTDHTQRATLAQMQGFFGLATSFVVSGYTMTMVGFFGRGDMRKGFAIVGIIFGIVYAAANFIVYLGTKGYDGNEQTDGSAGAAPAEVEEQKVSMRDILSALAKNKVWVAVIACGMMVNLYVGVEQASLPFYIQYAFNNSEKLYSIYSLCFNVGALVPFLLLSFFIKHLGNARTAALGCLVCAAGYLYRFIMADSSVTVMIIGWIFAGVGQGLTSSVLILSIFDARVYGLWKTGVDNEAVLMSGFSAAYKIGLALGTPIVAGLLTLVPYTKGAASQPESVIEMLRFMSTGLNALIFVLPFILYMTVVYKNEKNLPRMQAEIEARKAEHGSED